MKMKSKSFHERMWVVIAKPAAPNAKPMKITANGARSASGEATRPKASITARKATE